MPSGTSDVIAQGALFLAGGAAGYAAGRWIVGRALDLHVRSPGQASSILPTVPLKPRSSAVGCPPCVGGTPAGPVRPTPASGPPGSAAPVDPYFEPVPLDPYGDTMPGPPSRSSLSRTYDAIFDRYRGAIPLEYVRALASRESKMNPRARSGSARGLMRIVPVVLDDYNHRHGTRYESSQLDDPAINVGIGCELLHIIIASYHRNHPRIRNLQSNWNNARFVELLTFGWSAGFSEAGGVGRVARYLEQRGITELTIDTIRENAAAAGATKYLADGGNVTWCKGVAALYARERALSRSARSASLGHTSLVND